MRFVAFAFLIACSSAKAPPPTPSGSGSGSAVAPSPYAGPAERGPCHDAHECKLRSNCGCSCEAVVLTARSTTDCDEACNNPDVCKGHSLICDLNTQTCGAIPPAP